MTDLKTLYGEVSRRLSLLDFDRIWAGFHPSKFALYDEKECFFDGQFVEKTNEFLANTSIVYQGEHIAIWQIEGETDLDVLTSKIVHEMFHSFQMGQGETRWPNEMEALWTRQQGSQWLSVKLEEDHLLAELLGEFDEKIWERFCSLRAFRMALDAKAFRYEAAVEQIEGTAEFVELRALKTLSGEKYAVGLARLREKLNNPTDLLPIRPRCYSSGAALISILAERGETGFQCFSPELTAVAVLEGVSCPKTAPDLHGADEFSAAFARETETIVKSVLAAGNVVAEGELELLALNIYDARRWENYLFTTYFVSYSEQGKEKVLSGDFVLEMADHTHIRRVLQRGGV